MGPPLSASGPSFGSAALTTSVAAAAQAASSVKVYPPATRVAAGAKVQLGPFAATSTEVRMVTVPLRAPTLPPCGARLPLNVVNSTVTPCTGISGSVEAPAWTPPPLRSARLAETVALRKVTRAVSATSTPPPYSVARLRSMVVSAMIAQTIPERPAT